MQVTAVSHCFHNMDCFIKRNLPKIMLTCFTFCTKPPLAPDVNQHTEEKHLQEKHRDQVFNVRQKDMRLLQYCTLLVWVVEKKLFPGAVRTIHVHMESEMDSGSHQKSLELFMTSFSQVLNGPYTISIKLCYPDITDGPSDKNLPQLSAALVYKCGTSLLSGQLPGKKPN